MAHKKKPPYLGFFTTANKQKNWKLHLNDMNYLKKGYSGAYYIQRNETKRYSARVSRTMNIKFSYRLQSSKIRKISGQ